MNRVGQNLVRNSDVKVPVTIKVLDAEEVNAMALPGGFFFVNSGLILKAENESELAGVMAHEIAHIAARHGTRQATRGQVVNLASIPLIFMGGWTGYGIRQAASILVPIGFLKFSRSLRAGSGFARLAVPVQGRLRSDLFRRLLRKDPVDGEEEAGHHGEGLLVPPDDRRSHQGLAEEHSGDPGRRSPNTWSPLPSSTTCRARLGQLQNRRKIDDKDDNRPQLKKAPGGSTSPIEDKDSKGKKQTKRTNVRL